MATTVLEVIDEEEEDSELICELYEVLEKHGVDEGLRDTIADMVMRWEIEQPEGGEVLIKVQPGLVTGTLKE